MCGICGIVGDRDQEQAATRVRLMMQAMAHRGPDGEGIFSTPGATLGMRRLSIIDISGGQQPIWNESRTLAVIFNGEIYNFRELRSLLEDLGHTFVTQSDTEILVHAYESWGADCVQRLRGMFAFAIMELCEGPPNSVRRVFLARDRTGIKPLYYTFAEESFLFASEVRALLASGCVSRQPSASAVYSYLLFGSVCEPMSIVDGIYSVPPGYRGFVSPVSPSHFSPEPYWGIHDAMQARGTPAIGRPAEPIRAALEDSVRHHLLADVPVGVFLSGGLDSTTLAVLASKQCSELKTITVAFSEEEFSEGELARSTANRLESEHFEVLLTDEEMRVRLDEAIAAFDQPSIDGINTFFISWAARQAGLKVALSGLGSDEIFGGYSTFRHTTQMAAITSSARFLPRSVRAGLFHLLLCHSPARGHRDRVLKAAAGLADSSEFPHPYFYTRALFVPQIAVRLLRCSSGEWKRSSSFQWLSQAAQEVRETDDFTSVSWLEIRSYLANMLLRDTDAMSMRHSVEIRVPFLDDPLLRLAFSLSGATKRPSGAPKALLMDAIRDLLPENVFHRPKRTFTLPWEVWLRGPLGDQVSASLSNCDACLAPIIDTDEVKQVWQDFLEGRTSWSRPWSLFILNEWVKRNLASAPASLSCENNARAPALT